ncbi:MAG: hypothetical protein H7Y22_01355 [Gemmatimonadaceae bacterium]|nr:hypothetical protein [Gloeobacterales cyanobacterium ES-bin-141]
MATFTVDNNPTQATLTWTTVAPSPIARFEAQGVTVSNKLYVFGGFVDGALTTTKRSDVYDSSTNTWRRIADLPELITHAAVVVDGQSIYLIGGYVGNSPGVSTSHVWKYSIPNNTWSAAPPLPAIRGAGAAVRLGRNLHYFGGAVRTASQPVGVDRGNHYRLSLDGGTAWSSLAPLPNPRNHLGGATDGVVIYAVGGQHGEDEDNGNDAQVDIYDPRTGTWIRTTDLPRPRGHISSSTFFKDGYIFVVGGAFNDFQPSADVTAYDPVSAKWLTLPPLPQTRKTPVAGPIGSRIFSSTGNAGSGASPSKTTYRSSPFTMSTPGSE